MEPQFGNEEAILLIGIDFGTTFSGVAWKLSTDEGIPDLVGSWPSRFTHTFDAPKVPSVIYYSSTSTASISWGYDIPPGAEPLRFFKLLLLEEDDLRKYVKFSPQVENTKAAVERLNKSSIEVIADYLRELWRHTISIVKEAKGEGLIDAVPFYVIVTVPAIWTDYARDRMRKAVELAGICETRLSGKTKLSLISEPEAAALSVLPEIKNRPDLQAGNTFIVCDCGGGTVDIITYKVESTNPLTISEAVEGEGALCGAIMVDQEFEASLKGRIGERTWNKASPEDIEKVMSKEWEYGIKKNFTGDNKNNNIWNVDFTEGKNRHVIGLTSSNILKMFESSFIQIRTLVINQIEAAQHRNNQRPKLLLLVGGYGQSRYLYNFLCDSIKELTVLRQLGERSWAAICRGAVTLASMGYGLLDGRIEVRARVARQSYGWPFNRVPFNSAIHEAQDREWDPLEQAYVAKNQMHWVIRRGELVRLQDSGTTSWYRKFDTNITGVQSSQVSIYTHNGPEPPSRRTPELRRLVNLRVDTPVPVEKLRLVSKQANNGKQKRYYKFDYDLRFEVSGASVDISLLSDGKTLATKYLALRSE